MRCSIIEESAQQAGRDFSKFFVAQIINCSIEDDHKKALDAVRWEVATKLDPVQISFIAAPKMRVGEPYIHKEDIPLFEKAHAQGGMEGLIKAIPDSYVEGMTASGTPDEVKKARAAIPRRRRAGAAVASGGGASDAAVAGFIRSIKIRSKFKSSRSRIGFGRLNL